jgi:DNA mismatch repair protein MutS
MAGMPREIVRRATDILAQLESQHIEQDKLAGVETGHALSPPANAALSPPANAALSPPANAALSPPAAGPTVKPVAAQNFSQPAPQLSIFETVDPTAGAIKSALEQVNINNMTPIECMMKLNEMLALLD